MPQKKSEYLRYPHRHPRAGCTLPSSGKGRSPLAVCPLSERQGSEQATSCRSLRTSAATVYAVSRLVVYIVHGLKGSGLTCTWGFAKIELERTIAFGRLKKSEWIMGACGALEGGLGVDANKTRSLVRPGMYVGMVNSFFGLGNVHHAQKTKNKILDNSHFLILRSLYLLLSHLSSDNGGPASSWKALGTKMRKTLDGIDRGAVCLCNLGRRSGPLFFLLGRTFSTF